MVQNKENNAGYSDLNGHTIDSDSITSHVIPLVMRTQSVTTPTIPN